MANYENEINSWPVLKNGLHYKWLVDYAAFSAFGTFELTAEEWEKRDLSSTLKVTLSSLRRWTIRKP